jgi:hypothetical protein
MKRQEILEIIVSNPQAIFSNASREAGKYSEYPTLFQVVGLAHDKSYVRVKSITVRTERWVRNDAGTDYIKDYAGNWVVDGRPIAERTTLHFGGLQTMPTRLVLKSEETEASLLANHIASEERQARENTEREAMMAQAEIDTAELTKQLVTLGLIEEGQDISGYYGTVSIRLQGEQITRLVSALKSALVEVGV